jgi:hypothetical protein
LFRHDQLSAAIRERAAPKRERHIHLSLHLRLLDRWRHSARFRIVEVIADTDLVENVGGHKLGMHLTLIVAQLELEALRGCRFLHDDAAIRATAKQ